MHNKEPLKEILIATRRHWDHPQTRPAVRENFLKVIDCRTSALGAEVFASNVEEKVVYHTCKSRACPSCGYRATLLWLREQWNALPDIPYSGIVFTMPSILWPILKGNRHLLHDLPALGAAVIEQWVKANYGRVCQLIMVVPHTFGGYLNFNCHLHILVSAGGLRESECRWISSLRLNKDGLMQAWRYAVITYLRQALKRQVLQDTGGKNLGRIFKSEHKYPKWIIYLREYMPKKHFLQYAARYARRPPIAQSRLSEVTDREVEFSTKDKRQKRCVTTRRSLQNFVADLAEHVPDRYCHAIRYFGLLAPRAKNRTLAAVLMLLGQAKRPRPKRLSWRFSLQKYFGVDPLDTHGQSMHWVRRLSPSPGRN